eukprot:Sdes_comp20855_c1_seq1m17670
MSSKDDWTLNPFAEPPIVENLSPFSDPSITAATNRDSSNSEEYNPFVGGKKLNSSGYTSQPLSTRSRGDFEDREAKLRERERELEERAARLEQRETEIEENIRIQMVKDRIPNWPKFPANCPKPFRPFIYHDIQQEIPVSGRSLVKGLFYTWHLFILCLGWNFLCSLLAVTVCGGCEGKFSNLFLSLVFLLFLVPCSFNFWYLTIYNGFRKDQSVNFFLFFILFGFQIIFSIVLTIGPPSVGTCGWFMAIKTLDQNTFVGVLYFLGAIGWTLFVAVCIYYFKGVHQYYRSSGTMSLQNAQGEAFSAASGSSMVQEGLKASILRNAV